MKKREKLVLAFLTVASVLMIGYSLSTPSTTTIAPLTVDSSHLYNSSIKTILLWNNFFEYKHMGQGVGYEIFHENHCPVRNCYIWDMADGVPDLPVEDFDLVWFHGMDIPQGTLLRSKPLRRKPHQRYLFYLLEAPSTFQFDLSPLDGFFNWTATYRGDSDIFHPYGIVRRTDGVFLDVWMQPTSEVTVQVGNKTRLVAWMVSNCVKVPSNRDVYVEELAKHISIDVFGACGQDCDSRCSDAGLEENYKFYLAFENSACTDYVTEKFFRTLRLNVVPIVFGGADYKKIAPPMSYIDANEFASPELLARHLLHLDQNPDEYVQYFWWKKYYTVNESVNIVCQVCELLNDEDEPDRVKTDLHDWWNGPGVCRSLVDVGVGTWLVRTLHYPGQVVNYTAVRLLATTNYAVILLAFIMTIVTCYCVIMFSIRKAIKKMWKADRKITTDNQVWNFSDVTYDKISEH